MLLAHTHDVLKWAGTQDNVDIIETDYSEILTDAAPHIKRINEFLGGDLNTDAMAAVVDRALYRQRK